MRLIPYTRLNGCKPLIQKDPSLIVFKRNHIYTYDFSDKSQSHVCKLNHGFAQLLLSRSRLFQRLFRYGPQCAIDIGSNCLLMSDRHGIYSIDIRGRQAKLERQFVSGIRLFSLCSIEEIHGFDDIICYGEYRSNLRSESVNIYGRDRAANWKCLYSFPRGLIDHVHSLVPDRFRKCVWIFTGDYDDAVGIWKATDNFTRVECVARGSQQYRCTFGFPLHNGILYATDSNLESNFIRFLSIDNGGRCQSRPIFELNGSCIYMSQIGNTFFFSTAYETGRPKGSGIRKYLTFAPGSGIVGRSCNVVAGNMESGFTTLIDWKVDFWPKKLFQFSTIQFPTVYSDSAYVSLYSSGCVSHDNCTEVFVISNEQS